MSAFEADRFNHSRTSPRRKITLFVLQNLGSLNTWKKLLQPRSAPPKKTLQQFGAPAGKHAWNNFDFVIEMRVIHDLHHRMYGAGFRIVSPIYQPPDPGMNHRPSTHRARFNCNKHVTVPEPVVT